MRREQAGLVMVEVAIVGPVALLVLYACIEIGRALFVLNSIDEATRRAARIATVVDPVTAAATITSAATTFGNAGEVKTANVTVEYLDATGLVTAVAADQKFVRVKISNLQHSLLIPFPILNKTFTVPAFSTTLPVESLGFDPDP